MNVLLLLSCVIASAFFGLAWALCRAAADTRAVHEDTGEYDE